MSGERVLIRRLTEMPRVTDAGAVDVWEEMFGHWHGTEERIGEFARRIEALVLERVRAEKTRDTADEAKAGKHGGLIEQQPLSAAASESRMGSERLTSPESSEPDVPLRDAPGTVPAAVHTTGSRKDGGRASGGNAQLDVDGAVREAHASCGKCGGDPKAREESDYAVNCEPHHTAINRAVLAARLEQAENTVTAISSRSSLVSLGRAEVMWIERERDRLRSLWRKAKGGEQ